MLYIRIVFCYGLSCYSKPLVYFKTNLNLCKNEKTMKYLLTCMILLAGIGSTFAQGQQPRVSPADSVSATLKSGVTVTIRYNKPSVKGRTIGKNLEPMDGKLWRAGANEATTFTFDKEVSVEGKKLPAGKYAFFTLKQGDNWTLIFNKTWKTWGAYDYEKNKAEDALQVTVKGKAQQTPTETLTYTIDPKGTVALLWGEYKVAFRVK